MYRQITTTVKRDKVGPAFGHIDADALVEVERYLAVFLRNCEMKIYVAAIRASWAIRWRWHMGLQSVPQAWIG